MGAKRSGKHELIQEAPRKIASCAMGESPKRFIQAEGGSECQLNPKDPSNLDAVDDNTGNATEGRQSLNARAQGAGGGDSLISSPVAISAASLPNAECKDGLLASLDWIEDYPNVVMNLRNQRGGDFVALAIPPSVSSCPVDKQGFPDDACGAASLPWRDGFGRQVVAEESRFWTQSALTAVRLGCGMEDFTFAHELAHSLGANHEDDERPPVPFSPLSPGNTQTQVTIPGGSVWVRDTRVERAAGY